MANTKGPLKVNGEPDHRYKGNEEPGSPIYEARHRNPHGRRIRTDRPMGDPDSEIVNQDGTLDMRFLENRVKVGLVDPENDSGKKLVTESAPKRHKRKAA